MKFQAFHKMLWDGPDDAGAERVDVSASNTVSRECNNRLRRAGQTGNTYATAGPDYLNGAPRDGRGKDLKVTAVPGFPQRFAKRRLR